MKSIKKKGRPYYYVREIARVDGKPKVINQVYQGSPDRILEMAQGGKSRPEKKIQIDLTFMRSPLLMISQCPPIPYCK